MHVENLKSYHDHKTWQAKRWRWVMPSHLTIYQSPRKTHTATFQWRNATSQSPTGHCFSVRYQISQSISEGLNHKRPSHHTTLVALEMSKAFDTVSNYRSYRILCCQPYPPPISPEENDLPRAIRTTVAQFRSVVSIRINICELTRWLKILQVIFRKKYVSFKLLNATFEYRHIPQTQFEKFLVT